jgi:hypothetical protein
MGLTLLPAPLSLEIRAIVDGGVNEDESLIASQVKVLVQFLDVVGDTHSLFLSFFLLIGRTLPHGTDMHDIGVGILYA